jgi:hypothetical protein
MKNKKDEKENFFNKFASPMPKHLTPKEREVWERELKWEKKEKERRRQEGLYGSRRKRGRPRKSGGPEFSFIS